MGACTAKNDLPTTGNQAGKGFMGEGEGGSHCAKFLTCATAELPHVCTASAATVAEAVAEAMTDP